MLNKKQQKNKNQSETIKPVSEGGKLNKKFSKKIKNLLKQEDLGCLQNSM